MAKLKDEGFKESRVEIEFTPIGLSSTFQKGVAHWIEIYLAFKFGPNYPVIKLKRDGQEISDIEYLINKTKQLLESKINKFEFAPIEPDYNITIKKVKYGNQISYEIFWIIDADGARGGVYCISGPAIFMEVTKKELTRFTSELASELSKIKKLLLKL